MNTFHTKFKVSANILSLMSFLCTGLFLFFLLMTRISADETIQFTVDERQAEITRTIRSRYEQEMSFSITVKDEVLQKNTIRQRKINHQQEIFHNLESRIPQAMTVTFQDSRRIQEQNNQKKEENTPLANQTYRLERKGNQLLFHKPDQSNVSENEKKLLRKKFQFLGKEQKVHSFFLDRTFVPDQTIHPPEQLLYPMFEPQFVDSVRSFKMTFKKTTTKNNQKVAVFQTRIDMSVTKKMQTGQSSLDIEANISLKGPLFLDLHTLWIISAKLTGTGEINGKANVSRMKTRKTLNITGESTFTFHRDITEIRTNKTSSDNK